MRNVVSSILLSLIFIFSFACGKGSGPTLPPSDPCSNVTPPRIFDFLYPDGHIYHPSVFLEIYVKCVDCDQIQVLDGENVVKEVLNGANSFNSEQDVTRIFVKIDSKNLRLRAVKEGCYFEDLKLNYKLGTPSERSYIKKAKSKSWSIFIKRGSWHQSIQEAVQWWNKPEWNEGVVHLRRGGSGFPINIYIFPREEDLCSGEIGCAALLHNQCKVWLEDPDGLIPHVIIHEFGHCIMVPGHSPDLSSFMSSDAWAHVYFPPEEKYWFVQINK